MKQYIKDNKIYNAPIKIETATEIIITNNETLLKEHGYEVYIPQPRKLTVEEEIKNAIEIINEQTDEKILNDFVWKDQEFYLTIENQTNFANLFIARDYLEFPQTIKTKTGYFTLNNKEEVTEFYLSDVNFIKTCLEEGWEEKIKTDPGG
jgi:hypothetical protein